MRATFCASMLVACLLTVLAPRMSAEYQKLTILPVPPGRGVNSSVFYVRAVGIQKVEFSIRTAAMFNTGGRSAYLVSVRRGLPVASSPTGTEVANARIVTGSERVGHRFDLSFPTCAGVGPYHVRVSNDSPDNPQQGIVSALGDDNRISATMSDPEIKLIDMIGIGVLDLERGGERVADLGSIGKQGDIHLRAKWHVPGPIITFRPVRIYLTRPDGSVAKSGTYYSFHSSATPKLEIKYFVTATDAQQSGRWKLRIVNPGDTRIEGFNLSKSSDPNPFVPTFRSEFIASCGG